MTVPAGRMPPDVAPLVLVQACEPLHIMYAYDDARVYAVNSAFTAVPGPLWAASQLFFPNGSVFDSVSGGLSEGLPADGVALAFALPTPAAVRSRLGPHRTYFVALSMYNGSSDAAPVVSRVRSRGVAVRVHCTTASLAGNVLVVDGRGRAGLGRVNLPDDALLCLRRLHGPAAPGRVGAARGARSAPAAVLAAL